MVEDMEDMVDTEAMEDMAMARDLLRPKLMLNLDMDTEAMAMEVMVMAEVMEDMVDTEAMEDMAMARDLLRLSQDMDTEAMVMEVMVEDMKVMEDMDTEAMDMESKMLFHELITKEVSFCQLVFPNSIISIITAFLIVSHSK